MILSENNKENLDAIIANVERAFNTTLNDCSNQYGAHKIVNMAPLLANLLLLEKELVAHKTPEPKPVVKAAATGGNK